MLDILLQGGDVIDGSGAPRRRADVAIVGDRVAAVEPLPGAQARVVINAADCVVCPGFIDMHSHADATLPLLPTADSLVMQGVTTAVVGQCGASPAPLLPATRDAVIKAIDDEDAPLPWQQWSTFGSYLEHLRSIGISVNITPLVGLGMIRSAVMLFSAARPTDQQLAAMQAEVEDAFNAGAIGVSSGLIYPPGSYADTAELIALTRPAGRRGGYYFSHMRGEGDTLLEAVAEAISIGRAAGASVEISHLKASFPRNWHKAARALELIADARAEGLDVSADMYPYTAGSTSLVSTLPLWAQEGGPTATRQRLADGGTRTRMAQADTARGPFSAIDWNTVLITASPRERPYEGRYVAELAAAAGAAPHTWVFDALLATDLQISMSCDYASEDNLAMQLRDPAIMIGSDSSARSVSGALSAGNPHPRTFGTFPRVLGRYVRELGVLALEDAVHRMCGLPARKLGWSDRGLLRPGCLADVVVFDPATIADRATALAPKQYPDGIRHVIINGVPVVSNGRHTQARPGRIVGHAPGRA